ncbi:hypothetical protein [Microbacterium resistens]
MTTPGDGAPERFSKLPTAPSPVTVESVPDLHDEGAVPTGAVWEPSTATGAVRRGDDARLAPWALLAAIVALAASLFVGWGIPVAIIAVVSAIMCLRRPVESRSMSVWALVLGSVATVYSAGWLLWAAFAAGLLG